uniref:Uncharacterized protein n=1 Tax=Lactuca sativa TaxID=4236 RepID=A0A9R1XPZ5_LACSA|nr:hypothetical protein LSAT_V11C300107900 [Lactuca sativa]
MVEDINKKINLTMESTCCLIMTSAVHLLETLQKKNFCTLFEYPSLFSLLDNSDFLSTCGNHTGANPTPPLHRFSPPASPLQDFLHQQRHRVHACKFINFNCLSAV